MSVLWCYRENYAIFELFYRSILVRQRMHYGNETKIRETMPGSIRLIGGGSQSKQKKNKTVVLHAW